MHCPQCGRAQVISDDVRFCRQCGFALDSVKDLLIPAQADSEANKPPGILNIRVGADPRSLRGLNQSVLLLGLAFVPVLLAIAQVLFGFSLTSPKLLIEMFFIFLTTAVVRFAFAVYEAKQEWKPKAQLGGNQRRAELTSAQSVAVSGLGAKQPDTEEIVERPSVTEHTTRLLNESRR
jgi:hypothetical protein